MESQSVKKFTEKVAIQANSNAGTCDLITLFSLSNMSFPYPCRSTGVFIHTVHAALSPRHLKSTLP